MLTAFDRDLSHRPALVWQGKASVLTQSTSSRLSGIMIVGIDLGTTNSLIAVWKDGRPQLVPNALGQVLTPSVIGLDDNGEILVGQPALERMLIHPELTASVFKRYMGSGKSIPVGNRIFRPEELSSLVLRRLKEDAEHWLAEPVEEAVISVPAYFNDSQRKATKIAGQLAGFRVDRLINEPTAAALAYGLQNQNPESRFLVFDLGGGTFDVTVLELFEGVMEVRASGGDNYLGGEDFVSVLVDRFIEKAAVPAGFDPEQLRSGSLYQVVRRAAERAKRHLTESRSVVMDLSWQGLGIRLEISEEEFKSWSDPILMRLRKPVERALRDTGIRPSELNEILLVGGATRMPLVKNLVARMFGRFPTAHINPDEAIALGAAVQAGLKARDAALREIVLTDTCPYTLGVEVCQEIEGSERFQAGLYLPILERNTVVPVSRVQTVVTIQDHQTEIPIRVYQGESRRVADNIFLGAFLIGVPRGPRGQEQVEIRFTYDINGLLEVEAHVLSTGVRKSIIIEENPGVMTADEIKTRLESLAHLKLHPRDQTENRSLLARAERLYEENLSETRLEIGRRTAAFTAALESQDPRKIAKARDQLTTLLNRVEDEQPIIE